MEQLSLFSSVLKPEKQADKDERRISDKASDWALVYLVTYSGGNKGNLFVLKKEDAQKLCEDECSHGMARGGRWMFQWTSLDKFAKDGAGCASNQQKNVNGKLVPFVFIQDIGKQDDDFDRLRIKKPTIEESREILKSIGYELSFKTTKQRLIEEKLVTKEEYAQTEKDVADYIKGRRGARA